MFRKMLAVLLVVGVVSSHAYSLDEWLEGFGAFFLTTGILTTIGGGIWAGIAWSDYDGYKYGDRKLYDEDYEEELARRKHDLDNATTTLYSGLAATAVGIGCYMLRDMILGVDKKIKRDRRGSYNLLPPPVEMEPLLAVPLFAQPPEPPAYRELDFGLPKPEALRLSVQGSFSWAEDVR